MPFSVNVYLSETSTEVIIPCNYKIFTFSSLFPISCLSYKEAKTCNSCFTHEWNKTQDKWFACIIVTLKMVF